MTAEMVKAMVDLGNDFVTELCNDIVKNRKVQEDWRKVDRVKKM